MVFFSIMVYKAYGSIALSNSSLVVVLLLVLCNVCRVYCSCSGPLSSCSCSQYIKDTNSQAQLQVCSHSNITTYLNLSVSSHINVRVVAELIYYNQTLEENITVTFPNSLFYKKSDPVMHFTLDSPLDSSVTKWTMLFCYETDDDFYEQFILNPVTCIIETEEQEDPSHTSSDVLWPAPSSSAIMLQDVQSKIIQYTTNSVSSAKALSPSPPSSWRSEVTNTNSVPSSTVYNWTTDLTTPTIPINTTTPSDEPLSVTESSSGSSDVATIIAVTACVCVTIIIGSLSLSLCIVKYTKYSRKSIIISYDDSSSYGGRTSRMDKDIYSSTVSLSSSIITTLAPLAWEQDSPKTTKHHLDHRAALTLDLKDNSSLKCIQIIDSANSDFSTTILYTVDSHLPSCHGNPGVMTTYITSSSTSGISSNGDESDTSNNTVNLAMPAVEMDKISEISVTPHSVSSGGSIASSVSLSSLEFEKDDHTNTDGRSGVVSRQQTTVSRCCSKNEEVFEEDSQETERHTTANNEELNEDPSAIYIVLTNSSKHDVSDRFSGGSTLQQQLPVYIRVNNQSPSEENQMFTHFQETVV